MRGAGDKVILPRDGIEHRTAKRPRTLDRDREIVGAAAAALGPSRRVVSVTRADIQRLVDILASRACLLHCPAHVLGGPRHVQLRGVGGTYRPGALVVISGYRPLRWWTAPPSRSTSWPRWRTGSATTAPWSGLEPCLGSAGVR